MALPALTELFAEPRIRRPLAAAALATALAGCTTQKTLTVNTEPPGAQVRVTLVKEGLAEGQNPRSFTSRVIAQGQGASPFTYTFDVESSAAKIVKVPLFFISAIPMILVYPSGFRELFTAKNALVVHVEKDGFLPRTYRQDTKILSEDPTLNLRLDPAGFSYTFSSQPPGAGVYLPTSDGWLFLGDTGQAGLHLNNFTPPSGQMPLTFVKEGYAPARVLVSADGPYNLSVRLSPRDRAPAGQPGTLRFAGSGTPYLDNAATATRPDGSILLAPGDYLFDLRGADGKSLYTAPVRIEPGKETRIGPRTR